MTPYLRHVKMESFGAARDRMVGPFSPHLNVVFGANESGKTTLAAFVGGVLFGWDEARGGRNAYKPRGTERAGSLFFEEREAGAKGEGGVPAGDGVLAGGAAAGAPAIPGAPGALLELRRVRNADGLQGDARLVDDIDKDTFRAVFSLTSDELRSLRNTTDVTARLLTAGSGTGASPAEALAAVQARLAEHTSRAASAQDSIVQLTEERDEIRRALRAAAEEMENSRAQDREFHAIEPERQRMSERVDRLNASVESLSACRAGLEKLGSEAASLHVELEHLHNEERRAVAARRSREQAVGRALARLTGAEDRAARERLEALAEREAKQAHLLDAAREDYAAARAAYEALLETQSRVDQGRPHLRRGVQVAVTAAMFALLLCLGVPLFIQGRAAGSLSYTSLGLVMVFFGLILAASALVLLFRPDRRDEDRRERIEAAHEAMAQCAKRLELSEQAQVEFEEAVRADLAEMGLGDAGASLRRARVLLDDARDARAEMALDRQRQRSATQRVNEVEARLGEIAAQQALLCERAGVPAEVTLAELDQELARCTSERAEALEKTEALNRRWGELSRELAQARQAREFDKLKTRYHELKTRIDEASVSLARLLLAQRMLEDAVAAWKSKSQPEVFAQASRLLALMTDGRWTRVALADAGEVRVTDSTLTTREPNLLSLGTCQQLYLALRIALLMCAPNVGRAVPVLADDILVNFDAERRRGAARALAELAETRQVILLTCHEEVVRVLQEATAPTHPAALIKL
ncbi:MULTISPECIES: AAA family ATPase [unclassified Adlercreutzia]|uniref:AAA family ATPase n=1 Tax=unclassified Adlercreutzia TaxID=2636013 RepID=UPI001F14CACE|nr:MULTISPECIES: AAA family ATPase [unclassified Adlercreutzia]